MSRDVHTALLHALQDYRRAEKQAVLLFAEVMTGHLYRDLDYGSMEQYAAEHLGFKKSKTKQFLRLARRLGELPELKAAIDRGELGWTAARELDRVATPETEKAWVEEAKTLPRRELIKKIDLVKGIAKRERKRRATKQQDLLCAGAGRAGELRSEEVVDAPAPITLNFTGEQRARFHALVEARRKAGCRSSREELVLEAMASTPVGAATHAPHHKIVTKVCPVCRAAQTPAPGGDQRVPLTELAARLDDAELVDEAGHTRRTVPPKTRAAVMARDGHSCQTRGCGNTAFLEVHHKTPVSRGGSNAPDNLITLCSSCHRALHQRKNQLVALQRDTRVSGALPTVPASEEGPPSESKHSDDAEP